MKTIGHWITMLALWWIEKVQEKRVEEFYKEHSDMKIVSKADGRLDLLMTDKPGLSTLVVECAKVLTECDAENYVEVELIPKCQLLNPLLLTVQWRDRKSPGTIARERLEEIEHLQRTIEEIDQLQRTIEEMKHA